MSYVYYGIRFYMESGTVLPALTTEEGHYASWSNVSGDIDAGRVVTVRPPTGDEIRSMERRLSNLKATRDGKRSTSSADAKP
jgi:hypothetical protein